MRLPLRKTTLAIVLSTLSFAARNLYGDIVLAEKGQARSVIVVAPGTMQWEGHDQTVSRKDPQYATEMERHGLRDSVNDLATYLGRMAGTDIEIVETFREDDPKTPIYIGDAAKTVFGPVGISMAKKFGFRVVVDDTPAIGLYGESKEGTSYAIYELLHRLGCRWFMPGEMGEVIPEKPVLSLATMDQSLAPATEGRRIQHRTADSDFLRRNRMGGNRIESRHTLERYIPRKQLNDNPEWRLHDADGNPLRGNRFRWTRKDVAEAVANTIIEQLDENYTPLVSLSPGDYVRPTEDPEERKHDPEPRVWEPAAGRWSVSDRLYMLANRVAERVTAKYPDVLFGILAYVNYNMPPAREPVHPNVIPQIAPIDFNRHHPMTWEDHPNDLWLLNMVEGWGKVADRIAYYAYGMNLAELSAPNPFITKWGTDIPIILQNHCAFWTPETMGGWESMMPGYYLSIRMTFYPDEHPEAILDDLWNRFYGAAAEPMGRYWNRIDRAWIEADEFSGAHFGYLRMFTPAVMAGARADIDEALALVPDKNSREYQRVKLIDDSLSLFELYMKMRNDWAAGKLDTLAGDYARWRETVLEMADRYPDARFGGSYGTVRYPDRLIRIAYEGGTRMALNFSQLGEPMLEWAWKYNPGPEADSLAWTAPGYDDTDWPVTHVVRETWSTLGHHNTLANEASGSSGRMVYRASRTLNDIPKGKPVYLWIGSTDGRAKVFVNGTHIPYIVPEKTRRHEAGDPLEAFDGFCKPARFDITDAVKPGENQFTILTERYRLNELGTGGLIGPVMLFYEK